MNTRTDEPDNPDEEREEIESLKRRLLMARAVASDLRDWITRGRRVDDGDEPDPDFVNTHLSQIKDKSQLDCL